MSGARADAEGKEGTAAAGACAWRTDGASEERARRPTGAAGGAEGAGARAFSVPGAAAVATRDVPGLRPTIDRRARERASDDAVGVASVEVDGIGA